VIFLRSLIFNIFLYLGIIFACFVGLPLLFLPKIFIRKLSSLLGWYFIFLTKYILHTPVNIIGSEKLQRSDKFFIASAHQSMFETFVYNYIIPNGFFVLKKELTNIPIFGLYLKKLKCVPIDRGKITKENLSFSKQILENISCGYTLIIFPQGTRVQFDEDIPLKKGARRIYENLKIGCLPVKLDTGKVWPKNSFLKFPGEINFIFKDFIEPNLSGDEFLKKLENSFYN
tara:strand:+ start:297 stop:983 length:687 start_codon:yes stop_codon:yes gene_type:complete